MRGPGWQAHIGQPAHTYIHTLPLARLGLVLGSFPPSSSSPRAPSHSRCFLHMRNKRGRLLSLFPQSAAGPPAGKSHDRHTSMCLHKARGEKSKKTKRRAELVKRCSFPTSSNPFLITDDLSWCPFGLWSPAERSFPRFFLTPPPPPPTQAPNQQVVPAASKTTCLTISAARRSNESYMYATATYDFQLAPM